MATRRTRAVSPVISVSGNTFAPVMLRVPLASTSRALSACWRDGFRSLPNSHCQSKRPADLPPRSGCACSCLRPRSGTPPTRTRQQHRPLIGPQGRIDRCSELTFELSARMGGSSFRDRHQSACGARLARGEGWTCWHDRRKNACPDGAQAASAMPVPEQIAKRDCRPPLLGEAAPTGRTPRFPSALGPRGTSLARMELASKERAIGDLRCMP